MRRTLVLLTTIMILATVAEAQRPMRRPIGRTDRWEFTVQTRYNKGKEFSGDGGSELKIKEDLGWGFGFGYNFNQHFNLGMLFTWRSVPYESTAVDVDDPSITNKYNGQMSTSTFGATCEWNILKGKFTPYVNGGVAWMHINSNVFAGWTTGCYWDYWWGYICGPVPLTYGLNTGAYTLGLGARLEMSDAVFLRGGYERGWVSEGSTSGSDMMRIDIGFLF